MSHKGRSVLSEDHGFEIVTDERPSVRLYNPEGFDPRKHLPEKLWKHADTVRYLVHTIHHQRFLFKRKKTDYVELKAAYLIPFFTDKTAWTDVIEALATAGVFEVDPHYVVGEKSRGYRLGPSLRNKRFRAIRVRNPALVRKILAKRKLERKKITWDVHRYLRAWLERIDFDADAAARLIARNRWYDHEMVLDAFRDKEIFFRHCYYGRVHHNISSLKSQLRQFLSHQGEKLVNLDIRNSQPLIFAVVLINYLLNSRCLDSLYAWKVDNSGLYYDLDPSLFLSSMENSSSSLPSPPLRLPTLITTRQNNEDWKDTTKRLIARGFPQDVLLYIELVQRGLLYEFLMQEANIPKDKRAEFKKSFFGGVFFCKVRPRTKHADLFYRLFPSVYDVVCKIKEGDYRRLSHILQRVESSLIINRIARRCMVELSDTCLVTIHDSVLTTPDGAEPIRRIMLEEFGKVGLEPTINFERYGS